MVLKKEISLQIKNLLKEHPQGLRITDIVKKVNINRNTAGRYLENLLVSGQVEMRRFGMAKIYTLSQRVPLSALLSISSELVIQLDSSLRVIYANEPFLLLVRTDIKSLLGKNIEYTSVALIFEDFITEFIKNLKEGVNGKEWIGEILLRPKEITLFCRIAPTVFDDGRKGVTVILEDITKQKEAEQKLEESERQFRLLAENSLDMISRIKPDGTRIYVSPAYKTTLGYEPGELIGKNNDDFIHPNDAQVLESLGKILTHENPSTTISFRTKHKDGHYVWIESAVKAIFDEVTGGLTEYYTVTRDITQRKKEQELLQESEDKYRKLVEISPDAIIIHQEGKISYVNPAAVTLLGGSHTDEIIGKNVLDTIHPDFHDSVMKNIEKDLKDEDSPSLVLQMIRIDGTSIIVEGRGVRTFLGGKPAIQVALRDITERKHTEDALRESEGKLNAMLQSIPDIISMMDEELTIIWANEPAKRYFGKDIIGKKCYEAYHRIQDSCEPYPCFTLKAFLDGKTHQHETTVIDSQGKTHFFECTATVALRDNSGKPVAVLEISRDITDKKKSDDELRESEEKYRTLIERANDGVVVIQDNIVKMCNHYITEFWGGGTIDQMVGRNFTDFIHPDALPDVVNRYNRRMAGEPVPPIYESILKRRDGSRFFAELNAGIISYEGKPADLIIVRDINERKKVQDALGKSESLYRTLAEASNDLIFLIDKDDRVEYVNSYAAAIMNKTADQLIGSPRHILFPPQVAKTQKKALETVFETGTSIRQEGPLTFAGQIHWFDHVLTPLRDADNTIRSVLGISRDITERKNTEIALHDSEATARALMNAPTDSVILIDDQGVILAINEIAASRFGKRSDELVGSMSYDLLPKEIAQFRRSLMAPILEKREPVRFVDERAGTWYDTVAYPILDETGEVKKIAIIARDITKQKIFEKRLHESEQMFKRLLEQTFDATMIHKEGKITFLNDRAAKILGSARPQDLIGKSIFEFIHPDSRKDLEDHIQKLSVDQAIPGPVITEKFIRTDRSIVTIEAVAISFDDNATPAIRVAFREIAPR